MLMGLGLPEVIILAVIGLVLFFGIVRMFSRRD
jgi:hypothetical protein